MPLSYLSNDLSSSLWHCVAVFVLGSRCVGFFCRVFFSHPTSEISVESPVLFALGFSFYFLNISCPFIPFLDKRRVSNLPSCSRTTLELAHPEFNNDTLHSCNVCGRSGYSSISKLLGWRNELWETNRRVSCNPVGSKSMTPQ